MPSSIKSRERREREREQLREQILSSAMTVLINEGYEAVSIRRLADEIEYTPGAIYSYFADKEEIIFALAVRAAEQFNQAFYALHSVQNPWERLLATGRAYIRFAMERKEEYDLMFIMSTPMDKMAEKGFTEGSQVFEFLRATVVECMKQGYLPKADADTAAFAMWAYVHGSVSLFIRQRLHAVPADKQRDLQEAAYAYFVSLIAPKPLPTAQPSTSRKTPKR